MIFRGSDAIYSKRQHIVGYREACVAETAIRSFLRWSKSLITFDRRDHPSHVARPRRYLLIVDLIVYKKRLTKVLMDGGSGLNIMHAETLDAMGIDRSRVRPTKVPFHGIMSGKQAIPLGQIDLPITFGDLANYRMETLTFKVVGFHGTYHTILGRPCYAKFMAIPNYTYLKLKVSGSSPSAPPSSAPTSARSSAASTPRQLSSPKSSWPS